MGTDTLVPAELRAARRWILWRHLDGRKPPCDPDGRPLKEWQDAAHWHSYDEAVAIFAASDSVDGVGFVLGGGFCGLDLDDCRDPDTGKLAPKAEGFLDSIPSAYTEVSPSGKGVKVFGRMMTPEGTAFMEVNLRTGVSDAKGSGYFTVTGAAFPGRASLPEWKVADLAAFASILGARDSGPTEGPAPPLPKIVPPGSQEPAMFREACRLRRLGYEVTEIGSMLWTLVQAGRFPNETGREPWSEEDCRRKAESACRYPAGSSEAMRPETPREQLRVLTAEEVIDEPDAPAVIRDFMWSDAITVLVSESGTGKTFVLLDAAAHVAQGKRWHGRRTERGTAVYVTFESDLLNRRLRALRLEGHDLTHLLVIRATSPISPTTSKDGAETVSMGEAELIEALARVRAAVADSGGPEVRFVAIDTVRASLVGSEDSSESISAYLRVVRKVKALVPGAAVVLSHHAGWQDGEAKRKRERGSSAFRGNVEATFYLSRTGDLADGIIHLELEALKVRDGELWTMPLRLRVVELDLPPDEDGRRPTTLRVEDGDLGELARAREEKRRSEANKEDLAVLLAIKESRPTNLKEVRRAAELKYSTVTEVVDRLINRGLAVEGKRGEPYQVTPAGDEALGEVDFG